MASNESVSEEGCLFGGCKDNGGVTEPGEVVVANPADEERLIALVEGDDYCGFDEVRFLIGAGGSTLGDLGGASQDVGAQKLRAISRGFLTIVSAGDKDAPGVFGGRGGAGEWIERAD